MPPTAEDRLQDIREAIEELEAYLQGVDFDQFSANRALRLITERLLEIVCEAARNLPEHIKMEAIDIDWRKMADFANRLRHAYHSTETRIVWDILQDHLPPLKAFAESRIRE
ncbi:HepT-like ribonuclease domain-containing protein [Tardiphaga sp. 768_D3_N2_1]|uniref:HepT-like ribonuclease domain-containing protein n=1 Tax=Tardiphaga sp. 768_D3_N2_1 TaxID=3240783 RepID=UPI003F8CBE46